MIGRAGGLFGALQARRPGPVALALILWLALELAAFWIVTDRIGIGGALLVGIVTTLAGVGLLKRAGRDAVSGLRNAAAGGPPQDGALLDGTLSAIGGALLVLPGFVSDVAGLALAAPSVRGWIARRFSPSVVVGRPTPPGVIDLEPDDWRVSADQSAPRIERR